MQHGSIPPLRKLYAENGAFMQGKTAENCKFSLAGLDFKRGMMYDNFLLFSELTGEELPGAGTRRDCRPVGGTLWDE